MPEKCIFHIDVNSAFLSWSAVKKLQEDPTGIDLRTVPSAVGGDVETRHGIITARSLPAKAYGIQTAMPVMKALQLCPNLILVRGDFKTYRAFSHAFVDILHSYTGNVQQASIDEAYVDVTDLNPDPTGNFKHLTTPDVLATNPLPWPLSLADRIQTEIREKLGFTVNVGISTNKLLAKMASDFTKPDKIHTLYPEEVPKKMWPLDCQDLHGCGPATATRLHEVGINTIGELAGCDIDFLKSMFGEKAGIYLHRSSKGIGSTTVHTVREEAKGYSNETTTSYDINESNYDAEIPAIIDHLAESVAKRMQKDGVFASTIGVAAKTDDFKRHSRQITLEVSTNRIEDLKETALLLMRQLCYGEHGLFPAGHAVRLVGVSAGKLDHGEYRQVSLLDWMNNMPEPQPPTLPLSQKAAAQNDAPKDTAKKRLKEPTPDAATMSSDKQKKLDEMMKKIRAKFGEDSVFKGH